MFNYPNGQSWPRKCQKMRLFFFLIAIRILIFRTCLQRGWPNFTLYFKLLLFRNSWTCSLFTNKKWTHLLRGFYFLNSAEGQKLNPMYEVKNTIDWKYERWIDSRRSHSKCWTEMVLSKSNRYRLVTVRWLLKCSGNSSKCHFSMPLLRFTLNRLPFCVCHYLLLAIFLVLDMKSIPYCSNDGD